MQFTKENAEKVMAKAKTQTRRVVKEGEEGLIYDLASDGRIENYSAVTTVSSGYPKGRTKWQVGKTYAVCPGRGKPAIGRVKLLDIRKEKLRDIGEEDAMSEGIQCPGGEDGLYFAIWSAIPEFIQLWDSINPKGKRWADNPNVWVLTFEVVQ